MQLNLVVYMNAYAGCLRKGKLLHRVDAVDALWPPPDIALYPLNAVHI